MYCYSMELVSSIIQVLDFVLLSMYSSIYICCCFKHTHAHTYKNNGKRLFTANLIDNTQLIWQHPNLMKCLLCSYSFGLLCDICSISLFFSYVARNCSRQDNKTPPIFTVGIFFSYATVDSHCTFFFLLHLFI